MNSKYPTSRYRCPCCGHRTLEEEPPGTFAICPVCFWEDDPVQSNDEHFAGGANRVSLAEARRNFVRFQACEEDLVDRVRAPTEEERA